jgi:hypothetical protein
VPLGDTLAHPTFEFCELPATITRPPSGASGFEMMTAPSGLAMRTRISRIILIGVVIARPSPARDLPDGMKLGVVLGPRVLLRHARPKFDV